MDADRQSYLPRFDDNKGMPRHRWYEFKEGFSASLVRDAIDGHPKRRPQVLDPFSGCGTTAIASLQAGCDVTAIEVNPFLAFAAVAKAARTRPTEARLSQLLGRVMRESRIECSHWLEESHSTFTERRGLDKWLFNRSVLRGYAALEKAIDNLGELRRPLKLALLAAAMDVCNARRDGKCLRYRSDWDQRGYSSVELRAQFEMRVRAIGNDLRESPLSGKLKMIFGDCRKKLSDVRAKSVDLIVTSPPYLNSFDYSDTYRPELFLGRFVSSNEELMKIRLTTVRSHVQADWKFDPVKHQTGSVRRIANKMSKISSLWDARLPRMVEAYFDDMRSVLRSLLRLAKPRAEMWLVVATSAYGDVQIDVDNIVAELGEEVGWRLERQTELRRMRSSGQVWSKLESVKAPLRESLIVWRNGE